MAMPIFKLKYSVVLILEDKFTLFYQQLTIAPNWVIASFSSRLLETESTPFLKVLLMVLLSPVELLGRKNLSSNLPAQLLLLLFQRLFSYFLLFRSVKVYSRSVLCSHIIPLLHTKIQMSYY